MSTIEIVETTIPSVELSNILEANNCACGAESIYGCHGFRDRQLYSEYYCKKCKNHKEE